MPYTTLISPDQLRALLPTQQALVLDCSFDLADTEAGARAYAGGHIPGAHYLHLDRDLCGPKTDATGHFHGRHPLPTRADFIARVQALGLLAGQQVVAYDRGGGMYAARLWWMLRWLGHANVAVLDGAWPGPWSTDLPAAPGQSTWQAAEPLVRTITADELSRQLGRVRLIDARAGERFRGEVEPLDKQAGHIPGASNRFFRLNLGADDRFKPAAELRAEFEALLAPHAADAVVHQCGSGVTACHNLLAMTHAGLDGSVLYPGSWSEWSADPARPIARA
jgi:thiosulfate/3-mercaptopyruvate sulfurtransferase